MLPYMPLLLCDNTTVPHLNPRLHESDIEPCANTAFFLWHFLLRDHCDRAGPCYAVLICSLADDEGLMRDFIIPATNVAR